ncbi:porin [Desulfococcus sp.]|uniref:porin n=1 Tax=Desulfococcus sp. TaxID=2025834 RepID=UPI003593695D
MKSFFMGSFQSKGLWLRAKTLVFSLAQDGGLGAWELGARWSWLDLTDNEISGGEENNFTLAVNWYLNPNYRFMFNYIYADATDRKDAEDGKANIFQTRFQVDF